MVSKWCISSIHSISLFSAPATSSLIGWATCSRATPPAAASATYRTDMAVAWAYDLLRQERGQRLERNRSVLLAQDICVHCEALCNGTSRGASCSDRRLRQNGKDPWNTNVHRIIHQQPCGCACRIFVAGILPIVLQTLLTSP